MNFVILLPGELVTAGTAIVRGERARRLVSEFGLREGQSCRAGVFGRRMCVGSVERLAPDEIEFALGARTPPLSRLDLEIVVGFARPQILKRVLLNATLTGVSRVHLVRSVRVEKSYLGSTVLSPDKLLEQVTYGLEQAGDATPPEIAFEDSLGKFLHGRFAQIVALEGDARLIRYFADTSPAAAPLTVAGRPGPVVLAIGPEGGWVESERELLLSHGFRPLSFGPRVLRVDTAVLYGVAQISLAHGF